MPLSLTQLYTVPGTVPLNTMVVIVAPEQIVCDAGVAVAFGVGFTVKIAALEFTDPLVRKKFFKV